MIDPKNNPMDNPTMNPMVAPTIAMSIDSKSAPKSTAKSTATTTAISSPPISALISPLSDFLFSLPYPFFLYIPKDMKMEKVRRYVTGARMKNAANWYVVGGPVSVISFQYSLVKYMASAETGTRT